MTGVTGERGATVGGRVAAVRRGRGMTQRDLARALGVSAWTVDRIETDTVAADEYLSSIADATDAERAWLKPSARHRDERQTRSVGLPHLGEAGRALTLGSIIALVTVRFFTEVVPVAPRAANFIDVPIFLALMLAAVSMPASKPGKTYLRVGAPAVAFMVLAIASATINSGRVAPAPVLVFIYGFLAPVAVYAAVYRIWPPGQAGSLSRVLVWLGLLKLAVVALFDLPKFATSRNPDEISGTFGTNAYQLVFFLFMVAALLAGIFTLEPRRRVARFVPAVILGIFAVTLLAQYRAFLVTMVVTMLAIGLLLGTRIRGIFVAIVALVAFGLAFSYVASNFPSLKLNTTATTLTQNPWAYAQERYQGTRPIRNLYANMPAAIVVGSGPATFSSRAWQTFASAGSASASNVQGGYAQSVAGGVYSTDVSKKYVTPQLELGTVVQGSRALSSPFSSYLSLAAEVGLLGLVLMGGIYVAAALRGLRLSKWEIAHADKNDPLPALALATAIGFLTLLQMGLLENWFEVTRVTFIVWIMLGVVTKEIDARSSPTR